MRPLLFLALFLYITGFIGIIAFHVSRKRRLEISSSALILTGLFSHTAAIAIRTYGTGRLPVANVGETLLFYSWAAALISAIVILRYGERFTELITMPLVCLALFLSLGGMPEPGPLPLILRTYWFEAHVITSFAAYALFTLAFSGAVLYIGGGRRLYWQGKEISDFQDIAVRGVLWGFFFFSASMFAGAVWGYLAWGSYWLW
ncbi:MAG: cytochrome c biogenesis protein CcsA [Deltaproteobacteria bacterium]|nr:cytochrome c biogenesis protein CcsA [Deltaproteobacteria bacterium]